MQFSRAISYKFMWRIKIPLRIKTFIWLVPRRSILTRNVLIKRGGNVWRLASFMAKRSQWHTSYSSIVLIDTFRI
jgi:hypothetical protein